MPDWLPTQTLVTLLVLAPVVGSFLGVLVRRLPTGRSVVVGRSACEACGHPLGVAELVPLASFVWLRGRCRACRARIHWMHPAIELASLAVVLIVAAVVGQADGPLVAGCLLGWTLLALAWIDAGYLVLPDVLTLPLVLLGLGATLVLDPDDLAGHAAAAVLGYGSFALVAAWYRWRRGRDGMGMGDAKLMAAAGAWVGVPGLAPVMLGGALLGLAFAGVQRLRGRVMGVGTRIPFGPSLAAALWLEWLLLARP